MQNQENIIKTTKIYLVTNCYGDPNKVYIGKTINNRKKSHIKIFGKQIIYDYIDEIGGWEKDRWIPLEKYWIEQFRQWGFIVMNKNKGGGGPEFCSNEHKNNISNSLIGRDISDWKHKIYTKERNNKISKSNKGFKHSEETKTKISKNSLGKRKSQEVKDKISKSMIGKTHSEYTKELMKKPKSEETKIRMSLSKKGIKLSDETKLKIKNNRGSAILGVIRSHIKSVIQYDLQGNFIKEWISITEAQSKLKIFNISHCCSGRYKTVGGYFWKYNN